MLSKWKAGLDEPHERGSRHWFAFRTFRFVDYLNWPNKYTYIHLICSNKSKEHSRTWEMWWAGQQGTRHLQLPYHNILTANEHSISVTFKKRSKINNVNATPKSSKCRVNQQMVVNSSKHLWLSLQKSTTRAVRTIWFIQLVLMTSGVCNLAKLKETWEANIYYTKNDFITED